MNARPSSLPTTGQVLGVLVECLGESKGKGVANGTKGQTKWAIHKQIQRLAKQSGQSKGAAGEIKGALIDGVAALFDASLKGQLVSGKILKMNFQERVMSALPRLHGGNSSEKRFTVRLIFWIVYFIDHHEWLCPQLDAAHEPDIALREWVRHTAHFCTNTLADTVRANPSLLDGLPRGISWNLPSKQLDGTVKWPLCHGFEWLQGMLADQSREELPAIVFPNDEKSRSLMCFNRMMRGGGLPGLDKIEKVVRHQWQFKDDGATISPEKLKAVLLWCRALQFALKSVEKHFDFNFMWELVDWHKRAAASNVSAAV